MIGTLRGKVILKNEHSLILDVNGVGYKILATLDTLEKCQLEKEIQIFTHLYVREDTLALYGFLTQEELNFFELLLSISGVGPKVALGILGAAKVDRLKEAIRQGNPEILTAVSGIGRKMASRVVLELKSKLKGEFEFGKIFEETSDETYLALINLGYSAKEAGKALSEIDPEVTDTTEKIKLALKILRK